MIRNITTIDTDQLHGRDLYADKLCHPEKYTEAGDAAKVSPASAEPVGIDGEPLRSYDLYRHRLSHPKAKTAGNTTGGR